MDESCEPTCRLRLGFSTRFVKNLEICGNDDESNKLQTAQALDKKKPETWKDLLQNIHIAVDHTKFDCTESMTECERLNNWKNNFERVLKI